MVEASLVGSAALSGVVLLAIFAALAATRHRHPTLMGEGGIGSGYGYGGDHDIRGWAGSANALMTAFGLLALGTGGVVFAYLENGASSSPLMIVALLATAVGLVFGTYALGRNAGVGSAGATAVTALLIGVVLIVVVAAMLLSG